MSSPFISDRPMSSDLVYSNPFHNFEILEVFVESVTFGYRPDSAQERCKHIDHILVLGLGHLPFLILTRPLFHALTPLPTAVLVRPQIQRWAWKLVG